jgi:PEP-CTERM motif
MDTRILLAATVAGLALAGAARADTLDGTDAISLFDVTVTPADSPLDPVSGLTTIDFSFGITTSDGSGELTIPSTTFTSGSTAIYPAGPNGGTTGNPFTIIFGTYGTFTETVNPLIFNNSQTSSAYELDLYLLGNFSPSGSLASYDSGPASLNVSFTENTVGNDISYSASGTLATPPNAVPEPASLAVFGIGLFGFLLARRAQI